MNIGENLWHDIVEKLKEEFSETTVGLWFGSATIGSLDGDSVTIVAEDDFKKSIIEKKYLPVLERMFEELLGFKVEVRVDSATGDSDARSEERLFVTSAPPARPDPAAQEKPAAGPNLRSEYTFDNFVVGSSNQLAQAAAYAVAQHPAELYNPLFLFGPSGLGKTHLLFAIMNEVRKLHPNFNILYVTSEEFTNELIDALALRQNRNLAFKEKYRNVDMLLVDDVHFIAGKYSVQEEFFHTFNALYEARKQIVISSDKPPKDIPTLEERLRSRFEWGLIADISKPDLETRIAILQKKAELEHLDVPDEVNTYIATKVESNIRELEGCLTRVLAYANISHKPLSEEVAAEALRDMIPVKDPRRITPDLIMAIVAEYFSVSVDDLKSKRRNREITVPRQVAMYLIRELNGASLPRIGLEFGGRDHTTVIHACDKVAEDIQRDASMRSTVEALKKRIQGA